MQVNGPVMVGKTMETENNGRQKSRGGNGEEGGTFS